LLKNDSDFYVYSIRFKAVIPGPRCRQTGHSSDVWSCDWKCIDPMV